MRANRKLVRFQCVAWAVLFLMLFFYIVEIESYLPALNYAVITALSYAAIMYGNALLLMPAIYRKKKYVLYFFAALFLITGVTYLRITGQAIIFNAFISRTPYQPLIKDYMYAFIVHTLIFVLSIAFRFTLDFFEMEKQQDTLIKQHAEAQLQLLKAQVQPHFLFNTLNNIYYVAQRESPTTADMLDKLSYIMRFFLDQAPRPEILLTAELEFIENYIALEKIRMRYPLLDSITISGDYNGVKLPPMLLIPLIENVFKHGVDRSSDDNSLVIKVEVSDRLLFEVHNSIRGVNGKEHYSGIGLKNLTTRLSLLFKNDFSLKSSHDDDHYTCTLNIPLCS
jgi:hypothetical protein